jgi:hypothetical protein
MNEPVAYVDNVWINRPDLAMDLGIGQMFSRCQLSDHQIPLYTHPVKELTREDRLKLIGTLKWAEDLLREAGHDEAVDEVQDCIMLLRKAKEK